MSTLLQQAMESIALAEEGHIAAINEGIEDYNELVMVLEARDKTITELRTSVENLTTQVNDKNRLSTNQHNALTNAITIKDKDTATIKLLTSQLKELQALNPKRLDTANKQLKAKNLELKKSHEALKLKHKQAVADVNKLSKYVKSTGSMPFYTCPTTGNTLTFLSNVFVDSTNKHGVPDSPVVEFLHKDRGITRQGILGRDGEMVWASASNTKPTSDIISVAFNEIKNYCKSRKIKLPKG